MSRLAGHTWGTSASGEHRVERAAARLARQSGNRCPYVSIVSAIVACPSRTWITFGCSPAAIRVEA